VTADDIYGELEEVKDLALLKKQQWKYLHCVGILFRLWYHLHTCMVMWVHLKCMIPVKSNPQKQQGPIDLLLTTFDKQEWTWH